MYQNWYLNQLNVHILFQKHTAVKYVFDFYINLIAANLFETP